MSYKILPVLIRLKYWYYNSPYLELLCVSHHLHQILGYLTETSLQHNPHHVLHWFLTFVLPHSNTCHRKYWIYQAICQTKSINCIIKLYINHITLWVKHATYQKAESLRANSLSNLDSTVNNNSAFNKKPAEFSMKW